MLLCICEEILEEVIGFVDVCRELIELEVKIFIFMLDIGCYVGKCC